jgi:hypothetical protein
MAAVYVLAGPTYRSVFGPLKGADFIQFFTLGHIARTGPLDALHDPDAYYRRQIGLVPESASERYLPVYPPQAALLFAPFAGWSYGKAALVWGALTTTAYAALLWLAWRPFRAVLPDVRLVIAAAAGFPPFWNLVLNGQTTIVVLMAFGLAWLALERGRPYWAGVAFSLLLLKPQFGLILAVVMLASGEWAIVAGGATAAVVQLAAILTAFGPTVLVRFVESLPYLSAHRDLLEPKRWQTHSFTTLTDLMPAGVSTATWTMLSFGVAIVAVRVWRSAAPVSVRLAAIVLATVLVNPHVIVYDVTVAALALIWIGGWVETDADLDPVLRRRYWQSVYWLYVALLVPTARFIWIQVSVLIMAWLFLMVSRRVIPAFATKKVRLGSPAVCGRQRARRQTLVVLEERPNRARRLGDVGEQLGQRVVAHRQGSAAPLLGGQHTVDERAAMQNALMLEAESVDLGE